MVDTSIGRVVSFNAPIGGFNATKNVLLFAAPSRCYIRSISLISDTATTGSDGSNNFTFQVGNVTDTVNLMSAARSTNGAELAANTPVSLAINQNLLLDLNDVIRLVITKTGSPTDLSSANVIVTITALLTDTDI